MTDYFVVNKSCESNIVGPHYPQCTGLLKEYDNEYSNKKSLHRFAHKKGEKINYKPDLNSIKIGQRTKPTDVISCSLGPGNDMVVSNKLFNLIKQSKTSNMQFFDCLLHKKESSLQYKWAHFIYDLEEFTDYKKTIFYHPTEKILNKTKAIKDHHSFLKFYNEVDTYGFIRAEKTVLRHSPLDFFVVGRFNQKHYASSAFKALLIAEGITGIEFEVADDIQFI